MSEENVETVRRIYEAAASRDSEAIFDLYDEGVVLDGSKVALPGNEMIYTGHDGLRKLFRAWSEAWDQVEYGYDELIDAGNQVVAVVTRHARGRTSGVEVEKQFALVWTIREGKAIRVVWFLDRANALHAAGLSE